MYIYFSRETGFLKYFHSCYALLSHLWNKYHFQHHTIEYPLYTRTRLICIFNELAMSISRDIYATNAQKCCQALLQYVSVIEPFMHSGGIRKKCTYMQIQTKILHVFAEITLFSRKLRIKLWRFRVWYRNNERMLTYTNLHWHDQIMIH